MEEAPVLAVEQLAVAYKTRHRDVVAVRDVSFDIRPGECLGLVGESGCGKSTVAFAIVNFLGRNGRITNGSISFKGQELRGRSQAELRDLLGCDIGMVYQEPMSSLNPTMRIRDQLAETLIAHRNLPAAAAHELGAAALRSVHMPDVDAVLQRYPHQLSGGQQQRVLIAMAMLNEPSLLIMDEPTTALDVTVEATVLDLVSELKTNYRTATLYISHNLGVIARVADKVAVMYAGELVEMASTHDIYHHPAHPYTRGLIRCLPDVDAPRGTRRLHPIPGQVPLPSDISAGCIFAPRCDHVTGACHDARPRLVEIVRGHLARCERAQEWLRLPLFADVQEPAFGTNRMQQSTEQVLDARHVRTYYPVPFKSVRALVGLERRRFVRAVDDVTIDSYRGRTLGIVGESGCGKSTLAKAIVGLEPLRSGEMTFLGVDIAKTVRRRDTGTIRQLQMVFQDPNSVLNPSYSVGDQIAASLQRFKVVPAGEVYGEVIRLLRSVKLDQTYYSRLPRQLSGGEKQRVGIARAIASNPAMVVCDEPVSALDVSVQAAVLTLLTEIQAQHNTSLILISHDLSSVRFVSDWVAVMYLGLVVESGSVEDIFTPPSHPYTFALLAAVPRPDPDLKQEWVRLAGNVPGAVDIPTGCRFHTRCPRKIGEICETQEPPQQDMGGQHMIRCHLPREQLGQEVLC